MKTQQEVTDRLSEYVNAVASNILRADQNYAILKAIGENAGALNQQGYGALFGHLQLVLADHFGLSITKVFERRSRKNPVRSIATVLHILEHQSHVLAVSETVGMVALLRRLGASEKDIERVKGTELTRLFVSLYGPTVPDPDRAGACDLSSALEAWKTRRDKQTAHDEAVRSEDIPTTTWAASQRLLDTAKEFVGVVGMAYLSRAFVAMQGDEDVYLLTTDAEREGMTIKRLLHQAGLTPPPWVSDSGIC